MQSLLEPLVGTTFRVGKFELRLAREDPPAPFAVVYEMQWGSSATGSWEWLHPIAPRTFPWLGQCYTGDVGEVSTLWMAAWGATPVERRVRALLCARNVTDSALATGSAGGASPARRRATEQRWVYQWGCRLGAAIRMLVVSDLEGPALRVAQALVPSFAGTLDELVAAALAVVADPARPTPAEQG